MSRKPERTEAVASSMRALRPLMETEVSVASLEATKAVLLQLCTRTDLFNFEEFPLPDKGVGCIYLIQEDPDGRCSLYVNCGLPGQVSRPHNHGGSWAIVGGVIGVEHHRLYERMDEGSTSGHAELKLKGELDVCPGTAVSMLADGIHSIHALSDQPLLHLHLYGWGFPKQEEREEYDLETGEIHRFRLENMGFIEDAR
ncbi:MAG: cysteine dioxygenase family protein [SAR324 cluster bacterium]|nr:cysteine dioxygenase family protein [SAR324 cluster bacterium]